MKRMGLFQWSINLKLRPQPPKEGLKPQSCLSLTPFRGGEYQSIF